MSGYLTGLIGRRALAVGRNSMDSNQSKSCPWNKSQSSMATAQGVQVVWQGEKGTIILLQVAAR